MVQVKGRERRSGGASGQRACEHAHWSSRAAGARAKGGSRREKEKGDQAVACSGRRGASSGALGRPEVAGGAWQGAATVWERTVACSRAPEWLAHSCPRRSGHVQRAQGCLEGQGRSKEMA